MKGILTILFTIITVLGFSQSITITVGDISGASVANSDSLDGKPPAYFIDTVTAQNITGLKTFDNLVADSIDVDSINISSRLILNGIAADSIIPASSFTGNLANSTTRADTIWSAVLDASGDVTIGGDLAVTGDISTVQWVDYGGTSTIVGWSGTPTANIWYKKIGNLVFVMFAISGTSNSTSATFSLPYASFNGAGGRVTVSGRGMDNGSWLLNPAMIYMEPNLSVLTVYKDLGANGWTASGNKQVHGQFWYEAQ